MIKAEKKKMKDKEFRYPAGHNWEGMTPAEVNEGYARTQKKETLSDFIEEDMYIGHPDNKEEAEKLGELLCIPVLKAKEKIQEAKMELCNCSYEKGLCKSCKIFEKKFGDDLLK